MVEIDGDHQKKDQLIEKIEQAHGYEVSSHMDAWMQSDN